MRRLGPLLFGGGIVPDADSTINPDPQCRTFQRAGAKVTEVPGSSHVAMLSHPDVVAGVIAEAASR